MHIYIYIYIYIARYPMKSELPIQTRAPDSRFGRI